MLVRTTVSEDQARLRTGAGVLAIQDPGVGGAKSSVRCGRGGVSRAAKPYSARWVRAHGSIVTAR